MIFGFLDELSSRRRANKAYEIERLVNQRLETRINGLPQKQTIDADTGYEIINPHTAVTYLLVGFDPEDDPAVAGQFPSCLRKNEKQSTRIAEGYEGSLETLLLAMVAGFGQNNSERNLLSQGEHEDQIYRQHEIQDAPYWCPELARSVKHLYKHGKEKLAEVISDIAYPLSFMDDGEQERYLREIREIVEQNRPGILELRAMATALTARLKSRPSKLLLTK